MKNTLNPEGQPFRFIPIRPTSGSGGGLTLVCCVTKTRLIWNDAAAANWVFDANGKPFAAYYSPEGRAKAEEATPAQIVRQKSIDNAREKFNRTVAKRQYSVSGDITMTGPGEETHKFFAAFRALCETYKVENHTFMSLWRVDGERLDKGD